MKLTIVETSIPSMRIFPPSGSISVIRKRADMSEDFPLPVRPTTPIFSPPLIETEMFFRTNGPSRYLRLAFCILISPLLGHSEDLGSSLVSVAASLSMLSE